MKAIKDTARAKFVRAAMAGDGRRFLGTRIPASTRDPAARQDARLARLLSFDLWWPQFCEQPMKLKFFFVEGELIVSDIVTGYLYLDDPAVPTGVYVQPEPGPNLIPGRAVPLPPRLGRLETDHEGERDLLWLQDTVLPRTREKQRALLDSGANHGGVLFPPGTPPEVRDYLLNPLWWPLRSGPKAARIALGFGRPSRTVRAYLGRDGAGFIYTHERREPKKCKFLDVTRVRTLGPSNRSRYRKLGKIEL